MRIGLSRGDDEWAELRRHGAPRPTHPKPAKDEPEGTGRKRFGEGMD